MPVHHSALDDASPLPVGAEAPATVTQLPMSVDVRSTSLALIAVLASLGALQWAGAVFIPLLMGVMVSYALSPAVAWLQRWHLPRAIGSALLLLATLGGMGFAGYSLGDDATALVESLPDAAQKLRDSLRSASGAPEGAMGKVQRAAAKLELAAEESGNATPSASRGVTRVQIERAHFNIKD
jgi:predicted PurR-regulated permease PerM